MGELFVGVMSGTSFDGVDLVLLEIEEPFQAKQHAFHFEPYPEALGKALRDMVVSGSWLPDALIALHDALGIFMGRVISAFLENNTPPGQVRAIGLHGQTLWHTPDAHRVGPFLGRGTLQIGNPAQVRKMSGLPVVYDFRAADMAYGGQGAPLAPFIEKLLLADPTIGRVALNLGGIANMTFLAPEKGPIVAFDSGPGNMLMDALMARHPDAPCSYDRDGVCASRGEVIPELLAHCKADPYFAKAAPKSTGRRHFGEAYLKHFLPYAKNHPYDDLVATAARLTAETVADALRLQRKTLPADLVFEELIVSGGGAQNPTLMQLLAACLPEMTVVTTQKYGVHPDAKEAWLMAALAWAFLQSIPGNIPAVTGAEKAVVLGSYIP